MKTDQLDLKKYPFKNVSGIDLAFSMVETDKVLLQEAKDRGFYDGHTPYNKLFSNLFFNGGKVIFKEGIDAKFKTSAWLYCKALMTSWEPKHEEKEAVCAMLMSELLEIEPNKKC